jgi:hypothetical protein
MKAPFIAIDRMTFLDFVRFYDPVTRLKSMRIPDDFVDLGLHVVEKLAGAQARMRVAAQHRWDYPYR